MAARLFDQEDKTPIKIHIVSTSHFQQFSPKSAYGRAINRREPRDEANRLASLAKLKLEENFPKGTACTAYGGLILGDTMFPMHPRDFTSQPVRGSRLSQQRRLIHAVQTSDRDVAVQVTGANDLKAMTIMKGRFGKSGKFIPVSEKNFMKWHALPVEIKIDFSPEGRELLPRDYAKFIETQVQKYCDHLGELYQNSNFRVVFHLSPLERQFAPEKHSMLKTVIVHQAYIHHFLQLKIQEMDTNESILNNKYQPIRWRYINVRDSFHKAEDSKKLFRAKEQLSGEMIHRNDDNLAVIREEMLFQVHRDLSNMGYFTIPPFYISPTNLYEHFQFRNKRITKISWR